jgi:hypothetical protein
MKQRCCKHVASLFFAYIAIRDYENEDSPSKLFQRSNMKKIELISKKLRDQVKFDLKWSDIIYQLKNPLTKKRKHTSLSNVFI